VRSINLLVADDSDDDVLLLAEAFKLINCVATIHRVGDGQDALEALSASPLSYDLVALDYYLPKLNALAILERVRKSGIIIRAPIVILSSHVNPQEHQRLRELGVLLIAEKPSHLDDLRSIAQKMLALVVAS
jgi:CheY-like chemotaxis protein